MEAHHSPVAKRRVAIMQLVIVEVSGVARPVRADVTLERKSAQVYRTRRTNHWRLQGSQSLGVRRSNVQRDIGGASSWRTVASAGFAAQIFRCFAKLQLAEEVNMLLRSNLSIGR